MTTREGVSNNDEPNYSIKIQGKQAADPTVLVYFGTYDPSTNEHWNLTSDISFNYSSNKTNGHILVESAGLTTIEQTSKDQTTPNKANQILNDISKVPSIVILNYFHSQDSNNDNTAVQLYGFIMGNHQDASTGELVGRQIKIPKELLSA